MTMQARRTFRRQRTRAARRLKTRLFYERLMMDRPRSIEEFLDGMSFASTNLLALTSGEADQVLSGVPNPHAWYPPSPIDEERIAAMNQRIFDRLFGEDDEDASPVTRH